MSLRRHMGHKIGVGMPKFLTAIIALFVCANFSLASGTENSEVLRKTSSGFDHTHAEWTKVLEKYVHVSGPSSTVNYRSLKDNGQALSKYLGEIEVVTKSEFDKFSENEKLAFLINAYNAFTVKLIVDKYPIKSIKDAGQSSFSNISGSPWRTKFFKLFGSETYLDKIEHDMIRKWFNEPRIHFAVVCASVGCPALKDEAYVASRLDAQLESAANDFIKDKSRNRFVSESKTLELSSIFKWYGSDFIKKFGSVESFLAPRITDIQNDQDWIRNKKPKIDYLDYDWSLNEQK